MPRRLVVFVALFSAAVAAAAALPFATRTASALRVCADPNNLPFSNERRQGFENEIAELVAREMHATVQYTWHAQRRGFVRNTLRAGRCDVIMGVPAGYEQARTTRPYYRSTYVFVYRRDSGLAVRSLDDETLRRLRVGVHIIGDDYANAPPVHALAARGVVANVRGYSLYGNYEEPDPPARLVEAVAHGEVDLAVVWGPLAGYFATRQPIPLDVVPIPPDAANLRLPFAFDISMGVRPEDARLQQKLNAILERRRAEIAAILQRYGVPVM